MKKCRQIIKLIRPKHWMKNGLILVPLFFDVNMLNLDLFTKAICGFFAFSFVSSIIYIINDINDIDSDRKSETKKNRPLAAGTVLIKEAILIVVLLALMDIGISIFLGIKGIWCLVLYLILNIAYSIKLKHVPIIDIVILVSGFLIRLVYGAVITGIDISFWLYMTVIAFSFYMGLGKRRNELSKHGDSAHEVRKVLEYYNTGFLDKNMYMCLGLAIMFYALWTGADVTVEKLGTDIQMWTVPVVIVMAMKYSLDIEKGEYGDPMEVIIHDKWLIALGILYVLMLFVIIYIL